MTTDRFAGSTRLVMAAAIVAALAVALAAHGDQQSVTPPQTAPGTGLVIGQILDAGTGKGIAGAMVTLSGGSSQAARFQQRVMADDNGEFVFTDLAKGSYEITAGAPGYVDGGYGIRRPGGSGTTIDLTDDERLTGLSIVLWRYGAIAGAVLDEANEPVVGVTVSVLRRSFSAGEPRFLQWTSATTDDRGVFRAGALQPGDYIISVKTTTTTLPGSVMDAYRQAPQNRELSSAIFGATNTTTIPGSPEHRRIGDLVLQDSLRGLVTPDPAANGALVVFPTTFYPDAGGALQATAITVESGEARPGIELHLRPVITRRVSGTLMGPSGPMPTMALKLIPKWADALANDSGFETASTLTDGSSQFTFLGVPPGDYVVRALRVPQVLASSGPASAPAPAMTVEPTLWVSDPVSVGARDVSLTVSLRQGFRVSGRLLFDGSTDRPAAERLRQIPVTLERADARAVNGIPPTRVEAGGSFASQGVPGGRYFVRIGGAPSGWVLRSVMLDGTDLADTAVELTGDVTNIVVTFTDRIAQVGGTARLASGDSDPNASVLIFPADARMWSSYGVNPRRLRNVRVSKSGSYSMTGLPAGDYLFVAVDDAALASTWREPKFLEAISAVASRVRIDEGQKLTQDLKTVAIR